MHLFADIPVPRDIPLPLPADRFALLAWLVPAFLLHILFVNLMIGGSLLTTVYELIGLRQKKFDALALLIANTVTVNKSLAVVLGIGPLLMISLAYTSQFYTSNALTGHAWVLIVPLVTVAFLLTYLHKYTWATWSGSAKPLHITVGIAANALFLAIPFIFLANVSLMNYPDQWSQVKGFFSTLPVGNGNVFLRYLHFLVASVAATAVFLCIWLTRSAAAVKRLPEGFTSAGVRRHFYKVALFISLVQFLIGPALLMILPRVGMSVEMIVVVIAGAAVALLMLHLIAKEIRSPDQWIGRLWPVVAILFFIVATAMGSGRQMYRFVALAGHQEQIEAKTAKFEESVEAMQRRIAAGGGTNVTGKELFEQTCATCHRSNNSESAPCIEDVRRLYQRDTAKMVAWAKSPGKVRPGFPQMPSFGFLGNDKLKMIAEYYLGVAYDTRGVVVKLPTAQQPHQIVIRHEATMDVKAAATAFGIDSAVSIDGLAVGDKVAFHVETGSDSAADHVTKLEKLPANAVLDLPGSSAQSAGEK